MKPLNSYDKKGILAEEVFVEIFEQEDAIRPVSYTHLTLPTTPYV